MWAAMLEVVVLPWVPEKHSALLLRVTMPSALARSITSNPLSRNHFNMGSLSCMAAVYTTTVSRLSRQ